MENTGHFKKGTIPWNRGRNDLPAAWNKGLKGIHFSPSTEFKKGSSGFTGKHTEEAKKKMSLAKKGRVAWNKGKPAPWAKGNNHAGGLIPWNKGRTDMPPAWNKGLKGVHLSPSTEFKKGSHTNLGRKFTEEQRMAHGEAQKKRFLNKENHPRWRGGLTPINSAIRQSDEYKEWRKAVFQRDDWTCVICQKRDGRIVADHIKPFSLFPELRMTLSNGRTLCIACDHIHGWKYHPKKNHSGKNKASKVKE